jgi:hypothetical protein
LAVKSIVAAESASSISSSSEVNSPLNISNKPTKSGGGITDLLDEISYEIKIEGASDLLMSHRTSWETPRGKYDEHSSKSSLSYDTEI